MEMQLPLHIACCLTGITNDSLTRRDHVYTSTNLLSTQVQWFRADR